MKVSKSLLFKSKIKISNHYVKRNPLSSQVLQTMNLRRLKLTKTIARKEAAVEVNHPKLPVEKSLTTGKRKTQMLNQQSQKRWSKFTNKTPNESTLRKPTQTQSKNLSKDSKKKKLRFTNIIIISMSVCRTLDNLKLISNYLKTEDISEL